MIGQTDEQLAVAYLLLEIQRLRDALREIADTVSSPTASWLDPLGRIAEIARNALEGK